MFNRSRSSQQNKRSGTFSFLRRTGNTKTSVPPVTEEERPKAEPSKAPSYPFVSDQKGEVDDKAEEKGKKDEEIRETQGKRSDDQEGPKTIFTRPNRKVKDNEPDTQPSTDQKLGNTKVFDRYWKHELDYDLEEVVYSDTNYYVPNAIALFAILEQSSKFARDNRFMVKHHPEYLDYAVAAYYSIIFFIQILRAQEAAGRLGGYDRSFLNRFSKRFKYEELPISSIFQPFLSTIVSTLVPDSQYGWIVPRYLTGIFKATVGTAHPIEHGEYLIQPMVPYMLMILRLAISTNAYEDAADAGANFNDNDDYIPIIIGQAAAAHVFNNDIQIGAGHARNTILYGCGVRYPFHADMDSLNAAGPKWRRSTYRDFPSSARIPVGAELDRNKTSKGARLNNGHAHPMAHLDEFLFMEKTADVDWFEELINQAALHARFFDGVVSLSEIPTTSGFEPTVLARMYDIVNRAAVADRDANLGVNVDAGATEEAIRWYPYIFNEFTAGFMTNRAGVEREEALQALTFATNAEFSIVTNQIRLGGNHAEFRTGEFWLNQQWKSDFRRDLGAGAKPMFKNWSVMYQEDAAVIKPSGY
jgi:hypothetical protein